MTDYELFSLVVNAITGLGTVGAVVVSLYLARNKVRPIVGADVLFYTYRMSSTHYSGQETILVEATNKGILDEYVEGYGYSVRFLWLKKECHVDSFSSGPFPVSFPAWLKPGEKACDCIPIEFFVRKQAIFFFDYLERLPVPRIFQSCRLMVSLCLLSAKCYVDVARCGRVYFPLGSGVRKFLVKSYLER